MERETEIRKEREKMQKAERKVLRHYDTFMRQNAAPSRGFGQKDTTQK